MLNLFGDFFQVVVVVLYAGFAITAFVAWLRWRGAQDVNDTPDVPLAGAQPGMVARIQGRAAEHGEQRLSVLGNVACVWHDWEVERREVRRGTSSSDDRESWRTDESGRSDHPFALDDGAGNRILVYPRGADIRDTSSNVWYSAMPRMGKEAFGGSMLGSGIEILSALGGNQNYRFTEHYLQAGEQCFVIGRVEAPGPADGPGVRGCIKGGGGRPYFIATGTPDEAMGSLRRAAIGLTILAAVLLAAAIAATIHLWPKG